MLLDDVDDADADAATATELLGMNVLDLGALYRLAECRFASNEIGVEDVNSLNIIFV